MITYSPYYVTRTPTNDTLVLYWSHDKDTALPLAGVLVT